MIVYYRRFHALAPRWIRKAIHVTLDGADREPERMVRGPGCLCQPINARGRGQLRMAGPEQLVAEDDAGQGITGG
jgi:hypothetical protein